MFALIRTLPSSKKKVSVLDMNVPKWFFNFCRDTCETSDNPFKGLWVCVRDCVCTRTCVYESLRKRKYIWRCEYGDGLSKLLEGIKLLLLQNNINYEILGVHLVIHLLPYLWGQHQGHLWPKAEKTWTQQQCFYLTANGGWTSICQ